MVNKIAPPILIALLTAGCAAQKAVESPPPVATPQVQKRCELDFPTQERVEYVFECMRDHGGIHYDNLYHCVCKVDYLDRHLDAETFIRAITFKRYRAMPGERGAIFRDPPQARKLRKMLGKLEREAEERCFPKQVKR